MKSAIQISSSVIQHRIFTIRGLQIMIDFHLSELYNVETKRLNEQVKRNINRFPSHFMFQLTALEWKELRSQIATAEKQNGLQSQIATTKRRTLPYVFTEQGVAMLSAVLNSETAVNVSIQIMDAFVTMRHKLLGNSLILQRLDTLERKQIESEYSIKHQFEQVFDALDQKKSLPTEGVFYDGQIFDAYTLASKFIKSAKHTIVLIDNYIDETTLTHLTKKSKGVTVLLLTKTINKQLELDVQKVNQQYATFEVKEFSKSHDRFLIIDGTIVYHLGASLKDLGKRWFAFSLLNPESVESLLTQISELQ